MSHLQKDSPAEPRAAFADLPPASAIERVFGAAELVKRQRVLVLPVLANPLCEHHLVVYTSGEQEDRVRLVAFSKRESLDPKVLPRDWSELCRAEMPSTRLDEFLDLLQDRLEGAPLELRDLDGLAGEAAFESREGAP